MIKVENYPNAYKEVYEILIKLCVLPEQVKTYLENLEYNIVNSSYKCLLLV